MKRICVLSAVVFAAAAFAKETMVKIPSDVTSGTRYSYDIQTADYWTNGLPAAGDSVVMAHGGTTPFATNSAPLYLEHLNNIATDFYMQSEQPFIFNSETNSILKGSGSLKAYFPFIFNGPVSWSLSSAVLLYRRIDFLKRLYLTGDLNLQSPGAAYIPELTSDSKAGCVEITGATASISNFFSFAGEYHVNNGKIIAYGGDLTMNDPTVEAALPSDGMLVRLDSSDASSFTLVNGNRISEWRDVSGSGNVATPKVDGKYPVYRERELGAYAVADTLGWRGEAGAGFKLGTVLTGVKTVFAVIGTEIGGGWLLGATDSGHRTFHRGGGSVGSTITDPILSATTSYSGNPNAVFRRNGRPINAFTTGYTGNWDIMAVHDSTAFQAIAGLACDSIGSAADRDGHQLIAEFIAYNRELSDAEIKQTEKYLYKKWFAGRTELRVVGSKNKTTLNVEAPVDGDSVMHVNRFYGRGGLVKKGPGTLYLDRPFETVGPFAINEGTLAVANTNDWHVSAGVTPQLPDAGDTCLAHFDASDLAHFTLDGNDRVLEWFDADGRAGVSAYATAIASRPPVLRRDAMNGKPVVDLGRLNGNSFLEFRNGITTARSALMVCNARFGGSFVFSVTNNVDPGYIHRGGSTSAMWGGYDTMCPLFSMDNKNVWIDGLEVKPTRGTFSGAPQILAINFTGNANIGRFGRDRSFSDRTGGNQLAEILIYNRVLTDAEVMNAEAYLRAKWFPTDRPVLKTVRAEGDGTLRAEKDLLIGTLGGTGKLGLAGGGKATVKGIGNNFAVKLGSAEGAWDIRHDRGAAPTNLTVTAGLLAWFDPSDESAVTTNASGGVTGFTARNNAGLTASVAYGAYYPTYMIGALNGKSVIDCGSATSSKGLVWSDSFTNAHTVICIYGSQGGGGHLFGSTNVSQAFGRDIGVASNAVLTAGQLGLSMVDTWIDGVQADAYSDGFNSGYQIVSVISPTDFNINAMGYRQSGSNNSGGQRYGEVLVYNTILSETQREQVEAYLAAKWFNTPIHGYTLEGRPDIPGLDTGSSVGALVIGEGETTSIGWRTGGGGFRKEGAGTLELAGSTTAFEGIIDVAEGTVRYTAAKYTLAVPEIPGLLRRYDASAANAFQKDTGGNVTTWQDANGGNPARLYFAGRVATERTNELNGLSVLDLGPFGSSGAGLLFDGELTGVRSVFMVLGSQAGGGFILGDTNNVGSSSYWHRGNAGCALGTALFGGCSMGYANGGQVWIDGTQSSPTATGVLSGGYQVLEIFPSGPCPVDGFALDRSFTDRTGGQRLGEVLFFDRTLSDAERIQVEAYLGYKWFNRYSGNAEAMPANLAHAGTVSVASGATFDLNGFTQTTASLAGGGAVSGGDVKVTDAITVEGLTLSGGLTLGDGVTVTVTPGSSVTVAGTLVIGEYGTVALDDFWTVQPGTYKLFSAGALSGAANLKNWNSQGKINGKQYYVKLFALGNDVYMTVTGDGTLLMFR